MDQQQNAESTKKRSGPTEKMLAAAERAATRHGIKLPDGVREDFEVCRAFLDQYMKRPTEKALAFAQKLAKDQGETISPEALADSRELSAWIDSHKAA